MPTVVILYNLQVAVPSTIPMLDFTRREISLPHYADLNSNLLVQVILVTIPQQTVTNTAQLLVPYFSIIIKRTIEIPIFTQIYI